MATVIFDAVMHHFVGNRPCLEGNPVFFKSLINVRDTYDFNLPCTSFRYSSSGCSGAERTIPPEVVAGVQDVMEDSSPVGRVASPGARGLRITRLASGRPPSSVLVCCPTSGLPL